MDPIILLLRRNPKVLVGAYIILWIVFLSLLGLSFWLLLWLWQLAQ